MKPDVNGIPTYELAETGKHDLATMLACCAAEADSYWRQPEGERLCAAPYYFERAAILLRKSKDYSGEVAVCERWKAIANDYKRQPIVKARQAALAHEGPRAEAILARLKKAKGLVRNEKAARKKNPAG
ncbi:hypothetical protein [Pseudomonas sp. Q2-TVG4-2]|uniref:hypothetical protein n=1 Tax=Pseudomonas sp. Q2-TVG4-2 TaxID=1685699 RepID=UPI0015E7C633|nr:hypothetical protein [Pseudomonas sp. Q2-TVG4-2]